MFNRHNHLGPSGFPRFHYLLPGIAWFLLAFFAWGAETVAGAAQSLAEKVAAIPGIRGTFHLVWENGSSLPESQSEVLRSQFTAQLNALHVNLTEDASAPALRVSLRETPSKLLFVASVQANEAEQVRIVEISRSAVSPEDLSRSTPQLIKKLVWRQREPIVDAAETPAQPSGQTLLLVLGRDSLFLYREEDGNAFLQTTAQLPAPQHSSRDLLGQIRISKDQADNFLLDLPGRTCHGKLGDALDLECSTSQLRKGDAVELSPRSQRVPEGLVGLAGCDHSAWTLSSDGRDRTEPDRLLLKSAQSTAPNVPVSASLDVPGPVLSLSSAPDSLSSVAVVFNLLTGNYEVYRVSFACGN